MGRREASRIAKQIYCNMGEYYLNMGDECWQGYAADAGWTDKDAAVVFDYYERTAQRVADWLGV